MSVTRVYLDTDHNLVPPAQAVWLVEREKSAQGKIVRESWHKVVSYQPPSASGVSGTPAPPPPSSPAAPTVPTSPPIVSAPPILLPPVRSPSTSSPAPAARSRPLFIVAGALLLAASLLLLFGAPAWLALLALLAGSAVFATALSRQ